MFFLYQLLFILLKPFLFLYFCFKAKTKDFRFGKGLDQRFHADYKVHLDKSIHIHVASVGEINAVKSLITLIQDNYKDIPLVITVSSVTGLEIAKSLSKYSFYFPLEYKHAFNNFNEQLNPIISIFFEVEVWPLAYRILSNHHKLIQINSRLSYESFKRFKLIGLLRQAISRLSLIIVQDEYSLSLFKNIKNDLNIVLGGNLKFSKLFDITEYNHLLFLNDILDPEKTIIAGSTYKIEEELIYQSFKLIRKQDLNVKLIIAPRRSERFTEVYNDITNMGFSVVKLSDITLHKHIIKDFDVILIDTIGDLFYCYSLAKIAFVGGTLVDYIGGHDVIEAGINRCSVIIGNYYRNNRYVCKYLKENNAIMISNKHRIVSDIVFLYNNRDIQAKLSSNIYNIIKSNSNSLELHFKNIKHFIK